VTVSVSNKVARIALSAWTIGACSAHAANLSIPKIVLMPQASVAAGPVFQLLDTLLPGQLELDRTLSDGSLVLRAPLARTLTDVDSLVARLAPDPLVRSVSTTGYLVPAQFNDPGYAYQATLYGEQGSAYNSRIERATQDFSSAGADVVVAVVDTGIAPLVDLDGKIVGQANFYEPGSFSSAAEPIGSVSECRKSGKPIFHGTAVASLIAARSNNNIGVIGVAEAAKILAIRSVSDCGGDDIHTVEAIRWAAGVDMRSSGYPLNPTPAKIINVSLGSVNSSGTCPSHLQRAVDDAAAMGAVVVSSAGNAASTAMPYPASCLGVIAVGSASTNGNLSSYSNFVPVPLMVSAPGGDKGQNLAVGDPLSEQEFRQARGTSYATAIVSGVLAKAVGIFGYANAKELHSAMEQTGFLLARAARCGGDCGYALEASVFLSKISGDATKSQGDLLKRIVGSSDLGFERLDTATWVDSQNFNASESLGRSVDISDEGSSLTVVVPKGYSAVLQVTGVDSSGRQEENRLTVTSTDDAVRLSQDSAAPPSSVTNITAVGGGGSLSLGGLIALLGLMFAFNFSRTSCFVFKRKNLP